MAIHTSNKGTTISAGGIYFRNDDSNKDETGVTLVSGGTGANNVMVQLRNDGTATFAGQAFSAPTKDGDPDNTLVTKDYLLYKTGNISGGLEYRGEWHETDTLLLSSRERLLLGVGW